MTTACTLVPSVEHVFSDHPESPARFEGLLGLNEAPTNDELLWLEPERAQMADVFRVHDAAMVKYLKEASEQGPAIIDEAPTYVTPASWDAALLAAGGALTCTHAVLEGAADSAFAIVRPPGHHAEPDRAMGFCLLNNLAIAVRTALELGVRRVLIVDYDAHHGNGTQQAFLHEDRVAYISTHQGGIYPGSGHLEDAPHARGRIINLPLPAYAGDAAFDLIAQQVLAPLAEHVQPDLIFVSAGYDAHWSDPLTTLGLSTAGYLRINRALIAMAKQYCQGRIIFVLEGGYDPQVIADNVLGVLASLTGKPGPEDHLGLSTFPEPDIAVLLSYLKELHHL